MHLREPSLASAKFDVMPFENAQEERFLCRLSFEKACRTARAEMGTSKSSHGFLLLNISSKLKLTRSFVEGIK